MARMEPGRLPGIREGQQGATKRGGAEGQDNGVDLTYQFHGNPIDFYMRASR